MNTLITGYDSAAKDILSAALEKRNHQFTVAEPNEASLAILDEKKISLIILSDYSEDVIWFCRQVRAKEHSRKYTIYAVIK